MSPNRFQRAIFLLEKSGKWVIFLNIKALHASRAETGERLKAEFIRFPKSEREDRKE
jgi:hypothetical protein